MKTGRNEPCPCGSGKKYKKCCLLHRPPACPSGLTPVELVQARVEAFADGDFAMIYDSYHSQSYFRRQFPDREAYIRHGQSTLASDFSILQCRILRQRTGEEEAGVIFTLKTDYAGKRGESFEMAIFYREDGEWRYHSSQKLAREEFDGEIEEIDWADFDRVKEKVFF